jgi:hypothetical protein
VYLPWEKPGPDTVSPLALPHRPFTVARVEIRRLLDLTDRGLLRFAGSAGGPRWSVRQQARLFESLERGWPIGQLLVWAPGGVRSTRWYLLDGHRRLRALRGLTGSGEQVLVRDLGSVRPSYLPVADRVPGRFYLPTRAMLDTIPFLRATRGMPDEVAALAEHACHLVISTVLDVVTLHGGTPAEVNAVCRRLLPGRVSASVLARIPSP